ncbi:hypothetical protein WMY93_028228 [Mugilogobius chulae]|uniref:Myosin tail domain-containing protein n=1 Tax=Mugilogobius chulae TaxID=88201 RepID=A0AAW0MYR2_9GOBI
MKRIEFMKKEVDELKNIIDARQAENEQIRNEACDWRNKFETAEISLEEVRAQLSAAQKAAEEPDSRNFVLEETVQKLQEDRGRLEVCTDQAEPLDSEVDQLKQVSEQTEVDKLRNEVDEWKDRKVLLDLKIAKLKESMREKQAETEEARNEVYGWKEKFIISENLLEMARAQLSVAQQAAEESNCKNNRLREIIQQLREDRGRLDVCTDQTDLLYSEVDQLTQLLKQKQVDIEQLRDEVSEWKGRKRLVDLKMTRLKQYIRQLVYKIEDTRDEVYEWMDKFKIAETSLDKVRAQLSAAQQAAERSDCLMFQLQEEYLDLEERLANSEKREKTLIDQNETLCSEMKDLQLVLEQNQAEIEQMKSDIRYLLSDVAKLELLNSETEEQNRILSAKAEQLECEKQKEQAETLRLSGLVSEFETDT